MKGKKWGQTLSGFHFRQMDKKHTFLRSIMNDKKQIKRKKNKKVVFTFPNLMRFTPTFYRALYNVIGTFMPGHNIKLHLYVYVGKANPLRRFFTQNCLSNYSYVSPLHIFSKLTRWFFVSTQIVGYTYIVMTP